MILEYWFILIVTTIVILSVLITYWITRRQKLEIDECRLKEAYYLEFIEALSKLVIGKDVSKELDKYSDCRNQLLLIGSAEVVSNLMKYNDYITQSNSEKRHNDKLENKDQHDILLTKLIKSMRSDLYKKKNVNRNYPIIHLTGRN